MMISNLHVERLSPGDDGKLAALNALFADAFENVATYSAHPPDRAYLQDRLADQHFIALVAWRDGALVGGLTAYELRKPEQARSEIYIYDLAVAQAERRRGVATALIHALKPIAQGFDAWTIFVQADYDDPPAIALYEKLGRREDVIHFDISVE